MIKINSVKHDKLWGYEIWLYSPVKGMETNLEDGTIPTEGPLVKILKADLPLSVQVHPDDVWAKELENEDNGKSESWFVLEHEENAEMIMGVRNYDGDLVRRKLSDQTFEEELIKWPVEKYAFYNIPAGMVHGVGAGNTVFEVQQPSDTTYRFFDYNRLQDGKPRELHIEKSIKVMKNLDWRLEPTSNEPLTFVNDVTTQMFSRQPIVLEKKSIVVNLETFEAYIGQPGERADFAWFAVVFM